jgi:DMSO/TMAO reductase YedYZ molybdopterin-dependent catalytic subunit
VRLADLLDHAGLRPGAAGCRFFSFDGTYTESLTQAQARRDDVLVAYAMEHRPISRAHGGPWRVVAYPMTPLANLGLDPKN